MEKKEDSPLGEWTLEELEAERERLLGVLNDVEQALLDRLGFARAVPVRELRYGGRLIAGFEVDPRPVVIFVAETELSCILKPANSNDLPAESIRAGRLGPAGSLVAHRASKGERIGVRYGGTDTGRIVAEFCPPNSLSRLYLHFWQRRWWRCGE